MTTTRSGYPVPDPDYPHGGWTGTDSDNLDKITKAQAVLTALLAVTVLLLAATLVLSIIGYNKITDRLDNIEKSTATTASVATATPRPLPTPTRTP